MPLLGSLAFDCMRRTRRRDGLSCSYATQASRSSNWQQRGEAAGAELDHAVADDFIGL
jgi:hypothetical protein